MLEPIDMAWEIIGENDFKAEPEKDVLLRVAKLNEDRWWYACYIGNFDTDPMGVSPISEDDAKQKCFNAYLKHKSK